MLQRHLFGLAIVVSVALHAGVAFAYWQEKFEPPHPMAVRSGRASISLRASAGASPRVSGSGISTTHDILKDLPSLPPVKGVQIAPEPKKPLALPKLAVDNPRPRTELPPLQSNTTMTAPADLADMPKLPTVPSPENNRSASSAKTASGIAKPIEVVKDSSNRQADSVARGSLPALEAKTAVTPPADVAELPPLPGVPSAENTRRPTTVPTAPAMVQATSAGKTGSSGRPGPALPTLATATVVADYVSMPSDGSSGSVGGAEVDSLPGESAYNPAPPYPADALRAGLEGSVLLRLKIDATGKVVSASVEKSSNVPSLDRSALDTIRQWTFSPARRGNKPVAYEGLKRVNFVLPR
jgi:protein TonB